MPGSFWTGYTAPTSPIYLQYLMEGLKSLGQVAQQYGENQQANKLMNTQNPPRAALVAAPAVQMNPAGAAGSLAGGSPQMESAAQWAAQNPNVPVSGSPPFSGGVKGMEMQMALNKQNQSAQSQQLENQYRLYQMGNMRSEMANRERAGNWMYPLGTNRFTPMPARTNTAGANNQFGLPANLVDANGQVPQHVQTALQSAFETNTQVNQLTGADLESFEKANQNWVQGPDGNWTNKELTYKFGKDISLPTDQLHALQLSASGAYAKYRMANKAGYGPYIQYLFKGGDPNPQQTPQPQQYSTVAGQTGKNQTAIGGAQQQQPLPNPLTGSQFINNYIQQLPP